MTHHDRPRSDDVLHEAETSDLLPSELRSPALALMPSSMKSPESIPCGTSSPQPRVHSLEFTASSSQPRVHRLEFTASSSQPSMQQSLHISSPQPMGGYITQHAQFGRRSEHAQTGRRSGHSQAGRPPLPPGPPPPHQPTTPPQPPSPPRAGSRNLRSQAIRAHISLRPQISSPPSSDLSPPSSALLVPGK